MVEEKQLLLDLLMQHKLDQIFNTIRKKSHKKASPLGRLLKYVGLVATTVFESENENKSKFGFEGVDFSPLNLCLWPISSLILPEKWVAKLGHKFVKDCSKTKPFKVNEKLKRVFATIVDSVFKSFLNFF